MHGSFFDKTSVYTTDCFDDYTQLIVSIMVDSKWKTTIEDITTAARDLINECSDDKLKQSYQTFLDATLAGDESSKEILVIRIRRNLVINIIEVLQEKYDKVQFDDKAIFVAVSATRVNMAITIHGQPLEGSAFIEFGDFAKEIFQSATEIFHKQPAVSKLNKSTTLH